MKRRIIGLLLTCLTVTLCLAPAGAYAAPADSASPYNAAESSEARAILYDFVGSHYDRTVGTQGEYDAALYLAKYFYELGLNPYLGRQLPDFSAPEPESEYEKYLSVFTGVGVEGKSADSHNVSAYLPAANPDTAEWVVIGAHYDDAYGFPKDNAGAVIGTNGAYDNGTGVAAMLAIAKTLTAERERLNVNVIFAGFGSEETGLHGSKQFVTRMISEKTEDFNNLVLMFNLDVVGAGDYLYLYTGEFASEEETYLHEVAEGIPGAELKYPPRDKKLLLAGGSFNDLPYEHVGQMSDHASFHNKGIPVAFFFTMNWDTYRKTGVVESVNHPAIMHTEKDTLAVLEEYYGNTYWQYMDKVANIVTASVLREDFAAAMASAKANQTDYSFWTNGWWLLLVSFLVLLALTGVVLCLYFNARKKAKALPPLPPPASPEAGTAAAEPFYIFGEGLDGDGPAGGGSDDGDDSVFGKEFEGK